MKNANEPHQNGSCDKLSAVFWKIDQTKKIVWQMRFCQITSRLLCIMVIGDICVYQSNHCKTVPHYLLPFITLGNVDKNDPSSWRRTALIRLWCDTFLCRLTVSSRYSFRIQIFIYYSKAMSREERVT